MKLVNVIKRNEPERVQVGVQIRPNHVSWETMKTAWLDCDESGVDSIWTFDHFFPIDGDPEGSSFECWTTIASMAAVVKKAKIGTLVTCYAYRNIDLLADMARTVNHASSGRFILGLGSGWLDRDYEEYGYEKPRDAIRIEEMRKSIPLLQKRFTKLNPKPIGSIPILIGGLGQRLTLAVTASYADMWNGWGTPSEIQHLNNVLDSHCHKIERNPKEIERTVALFEYADDETYDEYIAAGATHLIVVLSGPFYDLSRLEALLRWRDRKNNEIGRES